MQSRQTSVLVTLATALIVPRIAHATGVTLDDADVAAVIGALATIWHVVVPYIERFIPAQPAVPTPPPA